MGLWHDVCSQISGADLHIEASYGKHSWALLTAIFNCLRKWLGCGLRSDWLREVWAHNYLPANVCVEDGEALHKQSRDNPPQERQLCRAAWWSSQMEFIHSFGTREPPSSSSQNPTWGLVWENCGSLTPDLNPAIPWNQSTEAIKWWGGGPIGPKRGLTWWKVALCGFLFLDVSVFSLGKNNPGTQRLRSLFEMISLDISLKQVSWFKYARTNDENRPIGATETNT